MRLVQVPMTINLRFAVSEELNARLEQGEAAAFKEVTDHIKAAINLKGLTCMEFGIVRDIQITSMGEHNVIWEDQRGV